MNHSARIVGLALAGFFLVACESQGEIAQPGARPAVRPQAADAGSAILRTVEQRSPFGNTSYPANLLADGDFELTGRSEQMPWIVFFNDSGQKTLEYDTGGLCHSGVRCALIAPGDILIGYLASPKTGTMNVSLWIAPVLPTDGGAASLACDVVQLSMLDFEDTGTRAEIRSETDNPTNGWCHFTGSAPNFAGKAPVLWVTLAKGATASARVDDGVVKPTTDAAGRLPILQKMSRTESARVAAIAEYLRIHRRYGLPPKQTPDSPKAQLDR